MLQLETLLNKLREVAVETNKKTKKIGINHANLRLLV